MGSILIPCRRTDLKALLSYKQFINTSFEDSACMRKKQLNIPVTTREIVFYTRVTEAKIGSFCVKFSVKVG